MLVETAHPVAKRRVAQVGRCRPGATLCTLRKAKERNGKVRERRAWMVLAVLSNFELNTWLGTGHAVSEVPPNADTCARFSLPTSTRYYTVN